jgi:hypothetical protein
MIPALAPLLAWLLQFGLAYGIHAFACARGWAASPVLGLPAVPLAVGVATIAALVAAGWMLAASLRRLRRETADAGIFLAQLAASLAVFALLAIAFTAVPLFLVAPCSR